MLSKLFRFGQRKQPKKVHVSDSDDDCWLENFHLSERGLPSLERSQIRLLVYKDHDKRGDKFVLFDSKTDIRDDSEEQDNERSRPARKRLSSDAQLLGEMIFGSVEMTYKGPTVKAHSIRTPPQLLLTKVFALKPPRGSHGGSLPSNVSSDYSSSYRLSESVSESISSKMSPTMSSDNEENSNIVAKSVPVSSSIVSSPRSFQLQNIAEGFTSTSLSVDSSHSATFPRTSSSSYQRRWLRSQVTRMDYGCMRRNENFNEEMSMRLRRRPKIGIGILFSLWEGKGIPEENNRLFQNFVFSHFALFESHVHRLKRLVEKALLSSIQMSGRACQDALHNATDTFARSILNLYYAPRIRNPLWLTMLSQPEQCNSICDDLVPQIVNAVELYNTRQTNYFLASLLTSVLTYHVAWVTTVMPSSEQARRAYLDKHSSETLNVLSESNPYNPLWAQLSELYGACGDPTTMTRTVILGQDQQIVTSVLHILSYFIRCSEVFEQTLEQTPRNITSCLDSLQSPLQADNLSKETDIEIKPKPETVSEISEETITAESVCCFTDSKLAKYSENLSQNSKSYLREMNRENLVGNSDDCSVRCANQQKFDSRTQSENVRNSEAKFSEENFDSCGVDSGICSPDLDSSVEVLRNDVKKCGLNFQDCSKDTENASCTCSSTCAEDSTICTTNSEKCSSNSDNCLMHNSTICGEESEKWSKGFVDFSVGCEDCLEECAGDLKDAGLGNTTCEQCYSETAQHRPSVDAILDVNTELCACHGVCLGNTKEHKLWKTFLRTSCLNKNSRSLDRRCLSSDAVEESMNTKALRRYSSEKKTDYHSGAKLCVQKDGRILSLDRQSILDVFSSSYPLCPVCRGQLSFVDQDLSFVRDCKILARQPGCLCQNCDKVKPCACQMLDTAFGGNSRCGSCVTVNSDDYSSGISVQSFEAERGSLSSISVDSGLNEHCVPSSENLVRLKSMTEDVPSSENLVRLKSMTEDQPFALELPEAQLDENMTEDDMTCKNSQDCQLFSFGRSLMAGYCDQYLPDFALHGTDRCTDEQAKQSMQISLEKPVVDSPISETVIIAGDTDKWECTIKTLSKHRKSIGNHLGGVRSKKAERSNLVHDFLTSFCDLWELNMPATFCLMHLEDKMKELYLRSKVVSEYLLTQKKYVTMRDLMTTFGYGECDLALLMSIIGVHSPHAISRIPALH